MTVAELLGDLVRIPSVNPDGDPGTASVSEKVCAEYVAKFLRESGAEAWLEDVFPDRPNVVGKIFRRSGGKAAGCFLPPVHGYRERGGYDG